MILTKKIALKWLCITIACMLLLAATVTYLFDPFFQYHEPYFGLHKVYYNRDYQVVGSVRNFSYDSVLLGSSVAENFDSEVIDAMYDCNTLKVIRASGSTADLLSYLQLAHEKQDLKNVIWCLDIFALTAPLEVTLASDPAMQYLHTDTILDDATYLFNKDVLFQEIPTYIASSFLHKNVDGKGYDWSEGKVFGAQKALQAYEKPEIALPAQPHDTESEYLQENLRNIEQELSAHPDIRYTILFPPYSKLWWDCGYTNGISDLYFEVIETALPRLCSYDNVDLYYFQADREIVLNLDNYMDMIHYGPWVNQYMLDCIKEGTHQVTLDRVDSVTLEMREVFRDIVAGAL